MKIIICLDDFGGMFFNSRRQSRDRTVIADIKELCESSIIYMTKYSTALFEDFENVKVSKTPLDDAKENDFVFVENLALVDYEEKIDEIIVYKWNSIYPADKMIDIDLGSWKKKKSIDFPGYSHDKITREHYQKGN